MVKRLGGSRYKTRYKMSKRAGQKGKLRITAHMQTFNEGDKVGLVLDSAFVKGMFHPRFHGKVGVVTGKQGRAYLVKIHDKNKEKTLIAKPVHLKHV